MRNRRTIHASAVFGANMALLLGAALAMTSCGSSGNTITSPSTLSKCAVTVGGPGSTVPASGGGGSIDVRTERECQWTAQPEVAWVSITAGSSGQGSGTVQFTVAANGDPATRTGGVMVNGQRAQVTQAAGECKFELSSNATSLPQTGGSGSVDVRASSALCTWTATSDVEWISVTSNARGKGSTSVGFTVAPTTGPPRAGTLTIAGQTFNVVQTSGCSFTIAPTGQTIPAGGGAGSFTVNAALSCIWTATPNAPWISVTSGSNGNGPGTVQFAAAANTAAARTGTITAGGQTFTITQDTGCVVSLTPTSQLGAVGGGAGSVAVATDAGCTWTAVSGAAWIVVTSGGNGSGNGTVQFTFDANMTGMPRSGTIAIGGQQFTINQAGS